MGLEGGRSREHPGSMVHGPSHGPWSIHGPWCIVSPWSMAHLQSMVQDEDAMILRLSGRIFAMHSDDFAVFLDGFWVVD